MLWLEGAFDLVVSPMLLDQLRRALDYPKLKDRITTAEAVELQEILVRGGITFDDPDSPPSQESPDPDDN